MKTDRGIVVAGHICLDIIPALPADGRTPREMIVPGRLVKVGPATVATGGAVANTGLALHRLGLPVRLMGKLGDDLLGRSVLNILTDAEAALAADMIVAPGGGSSYTIVISPPGTDRTFLHHSGVNDTFAAADVPFDRLPSAGLFHFGYPPLMRRMYADGGDELARLLAGARDRGLAVSLDLSMPDLDGEAGRAEWPAILAKALPAVDLFAPSFDEILLMLDRDRFDHLTATAVADNLAAAADPSVFRRLADMLIGMGAAIVALKLGDRGLY
ncbi:MAG: carbohydrate kinase family protein, partial [Planctomycetota bacterium]